MMAQRDDDSGRPAPQDGQAWRRAFNTLRMASAAPRRLLDGRGEGLWQNRRAWYRLNVDDSRAAQIVVLEVYEQRRKADNTWGRLTAYPLNVPDAERWPRDEDREIVALLGAIASQMRDQSRRYVTLPPAKHRSFAPTMLLRSLLPRLSATGRFYRSPGRPAQGLPRKVLTWQGGAPWAFSVAVERVPDEEDQVRLTGRLRRGDESRPVGTPELLIDGCLLEGDVLAPFDDGGLFPWIWQLREDGDIRVSVAQLDEMLDQLWNLPSRPPVEMPDEWPLREVRLAPAPRLVVRAPARLGGVRDEEAPAETLVGELRFDYGGRRIAADDDRLFLVDRPRQRVLRRDDEAEEMAAGQLLELGASEGPSDGRFEIGLQGFADLVFALLSSGWVVEAEGKRVRPPVAARLRVRSGIDWLEMGGEVRFAEGEGESKEGAGAEGFLVPMPQLLATVRRREQLIRLDDGSLGLLPQEWLERYGPLARLGEAGEEAWRFLPAHAILIDTLLGGEEAEVDADFEGLRRRLRQLDELPPHPEPQDFRGTLRPYQRNGLAWLHALRFLRLGGCLADDMGLGKTVQILALLAAPRSAPSSEPVRGDEASSATLRSDVPSLVVVPRSLLGNWVTEAARFAPKLRVLAYHGPGRDLARIDQHEVVITTYGTLCRDIDDLADRTFDCLVLDEAQAIKNAFSQTAKACRRLVAGQRLALTGTPVENHLGELGSIFGFLNPGLLGKVPGFADLLGQRQPDPEALALLGRVLRPFILRRTKQAVLPELPEKTELTLVCDLRPRQKQLYDELREHYRAALEQRIGEVGLGRSKIQVIEALLRLRQAACHPGLVDPARSHDHSTKLDVLLRHLQQVGEEGHKALVFSQFTRFLALLRQRLDRLGVPYEYLDGKTRDRSAPVERFTADPECKLFLISLKAGGTGLNLTVADYVFLLDPWWNPAVEAQAIDRTHRIGQQRPVFAYRLIARGTVEEKILQMQAKKRELAEAILSPGEGLMRTLSEDDLRWLLAE
ncbi:MAG: DEAD/DEAH box helicase [Acidobacteriota bacterium]